MENNNKVMGSVRVFSLLYLLYRTDTSSLLVLIYMQYLFYPVGDTVLWMYQVWINKNDAITGHENGNLK